MAPADLYEDDNETYDYERGEYATVALRWDKGGGLLVRYNSAGDWNEAMQTPRGKLLTHASRVKEFTRLREMGINNTRSTQQCLIRGKSGVSAMCHVPGCQGFSVQERKEGKMRNNKNPWSGFGFGFITAIFIVAYLSGMIIDILHGTHEGGIKSGIGVGIILLGMFAIAAVWHCLAKNLTLNKYECPRISCSSGYVTPKLVFYRWSR